VFHRLAARSDDRVRALLSLAAHGAGNVPAADLDLKSATGRWGTGERGLAQRLSLLSWLVRNVCSPMGDTTIGEERRLLLERDPGTIERALELLRSSAADRGWWIFEGRTYPDAYIETPDAIVVIEGKRTEIGPTTCTTWMPIRHQIWRHMDAAREIRGRRAVFGMLIVAGDDPDDLAVPRRWQSGASDAMGDAALTGSFPHRSSGERESIVRGFLGVATWQAVCRRFDLDHGELPDTAAKLGA
jgi:hypothetical protein